VLRRVPLGDEFFGEGMAVVGERLVVLTWRAGTALVFDLESFERVGEFNYQTEGWGLIHHNGVLIMSDGSSELAYRDPTEFTLLLREEILDGDRPVRLINELEWVED
jgi:glutamine cyclotransferase